MQKKWFCKKQVPNIFALKNLIEKNMPIHFQFIVKENAFFKLIIF